MGNRMTLTTDVATSPAALRLLDTLTTELAVDVQFHPTPAGVVTAPAAVVTPGDPWLEPDGFGTWHERWNVIVAVTITQPDRGLKQLWSITHRVAAAAISVGAVIESVAAPEANDTDANTVTVAVPLRFKYRPTIN